MMPEGGLHIGSRIEWEKPISGEMSGAGMERRAKKDISLPLP